MSTCSAIITVAQSSGRQALSGRLTSDLFITGGIGGCGIASAARIGWTSSHSSDEPLSVFGQTNKALIGEGAFVHCTSQHHGIASHRQYPVHQHCMPRPPSCCYLLHCIHVLILWHCLSCLSLVLQVFSCHTVAAPDTDSSVQ